jgi:hypothetical protein
MPVTLDVAALPHTYDLHGVDLTAMVGDFIRPAATNWAERGLIRQHHSFGYAVAWADPRHHDWNHPQTYIWFVGGWGHESERYIANAVRKLRAALRTGKDTLYMRVIDEGADFEHVVESVEPDGTFVWGDYPYGGAAFSEVINHIIPVAVSCLKEEEDDWMAKLIGGYIGAHLLREALT